MTGAFHGGKGIDHLKARALLSAHELFRNEPFRSPERAAAPFLLIGGVPSKEEQRLGFTSNKKAEKAFRPSLPSKRRAASALTLKREVMVVVVVVVVVMMVVREEEKVVMMMMVVVMMFNQR